MPCHSYSLPHACMRSRGYVIVLSKEMFKQQLSQISHVALFLPQLSANQTVLPEQVSMSLFNCMPSEQEQLKDPFVLVQPSLQGLLLHSSVSKR